MVKQIRLQKRLLLPLLAILGFFGFWEQPLLGQEEGEQTTPETTPEVQQTTPETTPQVQQTTQGQTPEELGTEYINLLTQAKEQVSAMAQDTAIMFPLGVNYPIRIGSLQTEPRATKAVALGYVTTEGTVQMFTAAELGKMFDSQLNSLNGENSGASELQELRLVDNNVPVIDLIVIDPQTNKAYVVEKVRWIGVFRDALNATLNNQLANNDYDMSGLDLRRLREEPELSI